MRSRKSYAWCNVSSPEHPPWGALLNRRPHLLWMEPKIPSGKNQAQVGFLMELRNEATHSPFQLTASSNGAAAAAARWLGSALPSMLGAISTASALRSVQQPLQHIGHAGPLCWFLGPAVADDGPELGRHRLGQRLPVATGHLQKYIHNSQSAA